MISFDSNKQPNIHYNEKEDAMDRTEFGRLIKQRRKILRINQLDLSEISEVALHTISDIESGKGNPTLQVISKLCDVLGLEIKLQRKHIK